METEISNFEFIGVMSHINPDEIRVPPEILGNHFKDLTRGHEDDDVSSEGENEDDGPGMSDSENSDDDAGQMIDPEDHI